MSNKRGKKEKLKRDAQNKNGLHKNNMEAIKNWMLILAVGLALCGIVISLTYKGKHMLFHPPISVYADEEMKAVYEISLVRSIEDEREHKLGYQRHLYNMYISDRLSVNRSIPDTRNARCKDRVFGDNLPTVSVIICFINEGFSTLIRTLHSVINRTPPRLLKDIILVDDGSYIEDLHERLDTYINDHFQRVVLIRNEERKGMIFSRILGSRSAKGQVLVFLDSHCEVNQGWIEPLLIRISENKQTVAAPIIDVINAHTLVYQPMPVFSVGFGWDLKSRWETLPKRVKDESRPISLPVLSGGMFAIDKDYFQELGEFDPGLKYWGGENLEMSFKVWQCGGNIELVPCSRIGHIFANVKISGMTSDILLRNLARVAETWMDEYKEFYYDSNPKARDLDLGDLTDRINLRRRLACKGFQWYLNNIYPDKLTPDNEHYATTERDIQMKKAKLLLEFMSVKIVRSGKIYHGATGLCLLYHYQNETRTVALKSCPLKENTRKLNDIWTETTRNEMRLGPGQMCLETDIESARIMVNPCSHLPSQLFIWRKEGTTIQLYNPASGKCLQPESTVENSQLKVSFCADDPSMDFKLTKYMS